MRTRLSICRRKQRFPTEDAAQTAARAATIELRHYRCDRCDQFHLTSQTKGKRVPRPVGQPSSDPPLQGEVASRRDDGGV
ncbi:hypothetical protein OLX23_01240 [Novosphingobium sp. JCM 18896]|nr:hypothetical protein [Novosphingobium sp. JCM 18896]